MKQNGEVCKPRPALLFFIFRFEYLISGQKRYRAPGKNSAMNYIGYEVTTNKTSRAWKQTKQNAKGIQ